MRKVDWRAKKVIRRAQSGGHSTAKNGSHSCSEGMVRQILTCGPLGHMLCNLGRLPNKAPFPHL